jgi:hypothetical protein
VQRLAGVELAQSVVEVRHGPFAALEGLRSRQRQPSAWPVTDEREGRSG